jgi:phosphoglycolate phosphatase-like HAD superfamily hydrolase
MSSAFIETFGLSHPGGIAMDGRTDPWVVAQMAGHFGLACDEAALLRFHDIYVAHLERELEHPGPGKGVMPGVRPLLDALAARDDVFLALLTGNFQRGAQLKLEHFDLWRYFRCGAFGDGAMDRAALVAAAVSRVQECGGPAVGPEEVTVVGDTPLDVAAALAAGARSLAVATGRYDVGALKASGATTALQDLGDLALVFEALDLEPGPELLR